MEHVLPGLILLSKRADYLDLEMRILGSLGTGVQVCKRLDNLWPVPNVLIEFRTFPRRLHDCVNMCYMRDKSASVIERKK